MLVADGVHVPAAPRLRRHAMMLAVNGVMTVVRVVLVIMMMMTVTMCGLRRDRNGQKNQGRYEQFHNSVPLCSCF